MGRGGGVVYLQSSRDYLPSCWTHENFRTHACISNLIGFEETLAVQLHPAVEIPKYINFPVS